MPVIENNSALHELLCTLKSPFRLRLKVKEFPLAVRSSLPSHFFPIFLSFTFRERLPLSQPCDFPVQFKIKILEFSFFNLIF